MDGGCDVGFSDLGLDVFAGVSSLEFSGVKIWFDFDRRCDRGSGTVTTLFDSDFGFVLEMPDSGGKPILRPASCVLWPGRFVVDANRGEA